jgi:hypothetical protein
MSVLSKGKVYEGNERPPAGEPDILLPKEQCPFCLSWVTSLRDHDDCIALQLLK